MAYAHISDVEKLYPEIPSRFEVNGSVVYGATEGWYEVVREPLNPGAAGWGEAYFDEASQTIIKPSLPADPVAANRAKWSGQAEQRAQIQARRVLADPLPDNPSKTDIEARINALRTLQGV